MRAGRPAASCAAARQGSRAWLGQRAGETTTPRERAGRARGRAPWPSPVWQSVWAPRMRAAVLCPLRAAAAVERCFAGMQDEAHLMAILSKRPSDSTLCTLRHQVAQSRKGVDPRQRF